MRGFVLSPVPPNAHPVATSAGRPNPRRLAQQRLVERLDPKDAFSRDLARRVLEAGAERSWPGLRYAAFDVLGSSRKKADRALVVELAEALPHRDRLRPLLGLSEPHPKAEQEALVEALKGSLPISGAFHVGLPGRDEHWRWARELAARLPVEGIEELLRAPWASREGERDHLLRGGFVMVLGTEKLKALLSADLDGTIRRHLLAAASEELPVGEQADLGRWSHAELDPHWSRPLRDGLRAHARWSRYVSQVREEALTALRDFALSCDDAGTAADYAACLAPGEALRAAEESPVLRAVPRRVGRVAGALLRRDAEAFEVDVRAMADLYSDDEDLAAFLGGLVEAERHGEDEAPLDLGLLGATALRRPRSIRVLARAGHDRAVAEAAVESDNPAGECLLVAEAAIEYLDGERVVDLVLDECRWSKFAPDDYRRYAASLARRPHLLLVEAASALRSLSGSEADAVPAGHLRTLLETALGLDGEGDEDAAGEGREPLPRRLARAVDDAIAALRLLLDHRSRPLRRLALSWAEGLEPDEALVGLLGEKKESTRGLEEDFGRVLRTLAEVLAELAGDAGAGWTERAEALRLARLADEAVARQAAFGLCASHSAELRRQAAVVLSETMGHTGDEERLRALLEDESDAETGDRLEAALRKISSGTAERAVANLWCLLGRDPAEAPPARVLLSGGWWDERFVSCVDRARRRRGGEPGGYVDALNVLAELLVEEAVLERHDADPDASPLGRRAREEAEAIRNNDRRKPDAGQLLARPSLQQVFPWFVDVTVLRKRRGAHPAPVGSTSPVAVGEQEAAHSEWLFNGIVQGWARSMAETSRLRP